MQEGPRHQGLIATHNAELLQSLFDSPTDDMADPPVRKLYVEGGLFTEEDEDKYRFISDNIDDFDEDQYNMLQDSARKEHNSRSRPRPLKGSEGQAELTHKARQSKAAYKTQFVVKSRRGNLSQQEREDEELRREERYQEKLRQKLQDLQENQDTIIPKLNLSYSDDDEKKGKASEPFDIDLRDSLDDDEPQYAVIAGKSTQESQQNIQERALEPQDSLEKPKDEEQVADVKHEGQYDFVQDSLDLQPQPAHNGPPAHHHTSRESSNEPVDYHTGFQHQPGVHGNDPLQRIFYPQNVDHNADYVGQEQYDNAAPVHRQYKVTNPDEPLMTAYQSKGSPEAYQNAQQKHYNPQYEQEDESKLTHTSNVRKLFKRATAPERQKPDVDFIEKNKQLNQQKQYGSYSAMHVKKKSPNRAQKPSSAELVRQNNGKMEKQGTERGRAPLRKYPSESRVDDMRAPHHIVPMPKRPVPREAFAEPYDSGPLQHAVYTNDGQKFNVNINMKMMSPPPLQEYAWNPPQGIPQQGYPQGNPHYDYQEGYPSPHINQRPYHAAPYQPLLAHGYNEAHGYQPVKQGYNQGYNPLQGYNQGHTDYEQHTQQYQYRTPYYPYPQEEWSQGSSYRGSIVSIDRPPTPVGSPYKVLPPISAHSDQPNSSGREKQSPRKEHSPGKEDGSYMEAFKYKKNKRPSNYKKYTLDDYRKLRLEVNRGGLGPDTDGDEYREKKEKIQRQQEYARMIAEKNRKEMEVAKAKPEVLRREQLHYDDYDDPYRRHQMAKEYAKSIPKPKPKPRSNKPPAGAPSSGNTTQRSGRSPDNTRGRTSGPPSGVSKKENTYLEMADLQALQVRHEEEKRKAEMIRKNVEGVH